MTLAVRATYDSLRSLAYSSISSTYAALGSSFAYPARLIKIQNDTDGDMFISTDGSTNMDFIAANSFVLYDVSANRQVASMQCTWGAGTQFYVKQSTMPSKNAVYLTVIYALPLNPYPNTL